MALTTIVPSGITTTATFLFNQVSVTATTSVSSVATGALVLSGGLGVAGGGYFGGTVTATTFVGTFAGSVSGVATTATNVAGGLAGYIPMQTAAGATSFIVAGTTGQLLQSQGTTSSFVNTSSLYVGASTSAVNLFGGTANQFAYQTAAGATSFVSTSNMYVNSSVNTEKIFGGLAGQLVYQSATGTTGFINTATTGNFLQANYAGTPTWTSTGSMYVGRAVLADNATNATNATNLSAGTVMSIPYQSSTGTTAYLAASTAGYVLQTNGTASAPSWVAATGLSAGSVANAVTFNSAGSGDASGTTFNGSAARTISYNTLGAMPTTGGTFSGPVTFGSAVTFSGTATYILSTNTWYTDNILELHVPQGGVSSPWFADDGKDIGFRFHYYTASTDTNAALVLANDTKWLEWYSAGAEGTSTFVGSTYGNFKTGGIWATTGAGVGYTSSQIGEKLGVNGGVYVNGTITATTFVGALSGSSVQINTVQTPNSGTLYPAMVDSNNASATAEYVYTTSSFYINAYNGAVTHGGQVNLSDLASAGFTPMSLLSNTTNKNHRLDIAHTRETAGTDTTGTYDIIARYGGVGGSPALQGFVKLRDSSSVLHTVAKHPVAFGPDSSTGDTLGIDYYGRLHVGINTGGTTPTKTLNITASSPAIGFIDGLGGLSASSKYATIDASSGNLAFAADTLNQVASSTIIFSLDGTERFKLDASGYTYYSSLKTAHVYIKGTGANNSASELVKLNGVDLVSSNARGLTLVILNKTTLASVSATAYDTYGSTTASDNLATALNAMTNNQIGILVSYDAIEASITTNLRTAARTKGLFKLAASSTSGARRPYAAIFTAGGDGTSVSGSRHVIEVYEYSGATNPMAVITTFISTDGSQAAGFTGNGLTNALISGEPSTTEPAVFVTNNNGVAFGGVANYGTSGQVLQSNGDAAPTWVNASGLGAATVANSVTFNNGGSGDASGTTFNGSAARTISYNTLGAAAAGQTMYIGTTGVAINRTSASLALTGVSIDGNAGNVTGTVAIANGGTGQTTRKAASSAIANFGQLESHGSYSDFNSVQQWGGTFVQGSTNGPGTNSANQYYQMMHSLGSNYDWGTANVYAMQIAYPRNVTTPYISIRYKEGGTDALNWGTWQKIAAGYADTAGSTSGSAGSVANAVTFNNSGSGDASGTTYNGSAARTISYNTLGAAASNQTMYIGTTGVAINRTSASLSLTGVSIDGSAASATTALRIVFNDGPRDLSDRLPNSFSRTVNWDFVGAGATGTAGNYAGVMTFAPWTGTTASTGDGSYQLAFGNASGTNASGQPTLRIRTGIDTTWNSWYTLVHSGNISSYTSGSAGSIANFTAAISSNPLDANSPNTIDDIGYVSSNISLYAGGSAGTQTDGGLYVAGYSTSWYHEIYGDFRTGSISVRGKNSGTWQSWRTVPCIAVQDSAPSIYNNGDLWWESDTGRLKVCYYDGNSTQWVDAVPVVDTSLFFSKAGGAISGSTSINGTLDVTGNITATGEITAYYSDRRLKTNVLSIENPVEKVKQLNGIVYNANDRARELGLDNGKQMVGLFADEVEAILPQAVKPAPFDIDSGGNSISGENYKTVQYEKVVPLLVEAIKEQQKVIDALKEDLNNLRAELKK